MTRKGKIARLPQPIREQINRRLQNGEEGKQIAAIPRTGSGFIFITNDVGVFRVQEETIPMELGTDRRGRGSPHAGRACSPKAATNPA